jgi:hypothetical protein
MMPELRAAGQTVGYRVFIIVCAAAIPGILTIPFIAMDRMDREKYMAHYIRTKAIRSCSVTAVLCRRSLYPVCSFPNPDST